MPNPSEKKSGAQSFVMLFSGSEGTTFFCDTLSRCRGIYIPAREPLERHQAYNNAVGNETKLAWAEQLLRFPAEPSGRAQWLEALRAIIPDMPIEDDAERVQGAEITGFRLRPTAFEGDVLQSGFGSRMKNVLFSPRRQDPFFRLVRLAVETGALIVCFQRLNTLKRAVSNYRMTEERKSQFRRKDLSPSRIPPEYLKSQIERYEVYNAQRRCLMEMAARAGVDVMTIRYEDIQTRPHALFLEFFDKVGLPPDECLEEHSQSSRFKKSTGDDLREVLLNYDEIHSFFAGTPVLAMLEERTPAQ